MRFSEVVFLLVQQQQRAQHIVAVDQRNGQRRSVRAAIALASLLPAIVAPDVRHDRRKPILDHPARQALIGLEARARNAFEIIVAERDEGVGDEARPWNRGVVVGMAVGEFLEILEGA